MQCKNCGAEVGIEYRLCPYCKSEVQYPQPNGQQNQPIIIQNIIQNPSANQGYNQNYNNQGYNQNYNNQGYNPNYNNQGYEQNYNNQSYSNNPVSNFVNQFVGNNYPMDGNISYKNKTITLLLAIFLGFFGIHRLYAGKYITGIVYMFTYGLFGFGWIFDIVLILIGRFKDGRGLYIVN